MTKFLASNSQSVKGTISLRQSSDMECLFILPPKWLAGISPHVYETGKKRKAVHLWCWLDIWFLFIDLLFVIFLNLDFFSGMILARKPVICLHQIKMKKNPILFFHPLKSIDIFEYPLPNIQTKFCVLLYTYIRLQDKLLQR